MNIVQLIMNQLASSGILEKLASMIGVAPEKARSATSAAVPALLAGLTQVSSTPDGARKLDAAVDAIDDEEDAVADPVRAVNQGGGILQSLLGSGMLSGVASALSKYTGMGSGAITTLLGALGPMVLGMLKGQKRSLGLDASGLAGLLSSQKSNIASAMPSGPSEMLGGVPGLSGLTDAARGAAGAAGDVYDRGREAAGSAFDSGRTALADTGRRAREMSGSSSLAWLWAIPLALLVGLLGWMAYRASRPAPTETVVNAPAPTVAPTTAPSPALPRTEPGPLAGAPAPTTAPALGGVDLGSEARTAAEAVAPQGTAPAADVPTQFADVTKGLTESLAKVQDPASADAALPALRELSKKLDSISTMTSQLPSAARTQLATAADTSRTAFQKAAEKAMAIPGVGEKLKPVIDKLTKKLDAIAGR